MADETRELEDGVEADSRDARDIVVPLVTEELSVTKRVVPKSRVQVSRVTRQHEELVDELLACEHVQIERTAVGRRVDQVPAVREEGDTIIVPILEEVLTIERHLVLKEEVRIKKVREEQRHQERVVLRKQEAVVSRLPIDNSAAAGGD